MLIFVCQYNAMMIMSLLYANFYCSPSTMGAIMKTENVNNEFLWFLKAAANHCTTVSKSPSGPPVRYLCVLIGDLQQQGQVRVVEGVV